MRPPSVFRNAAASDIRSHTNGVITVKQPPSHRHSPVRKPPSTYVTGTGIPLRVIKSNRKGGGRSFAELRLHEIERLYRDAPLLMIGEGTNEMQRIIIARRLIARNPA